MHSVCSGLCKLIDHRHEWKQRLPIFPEHTVLCGKHPCPKTTHNPCRGRGRNSHNSHHYARSAVPVPRYSPHVRHNPSPPCPPQPHSPCPPQTHSPMSTTTQVPHVHHNPTPPCPPQPQFLVSTTAPVPIATRVPFPHLTHHVHTAYLPMFPTWPASLPPSPVSSATSREAYRLMSGPAFCPRAYLSVSVPLSSCSLPCQPQPHCPPPRPMSTAVAGRRAVSPRLSVPPLRLLLPPAARESHPASLIDAGGRAAGSVRLPETFPRRLIDLQATDCVTMSDGEMLPRALEKRCHEQ